MNQVDWFQMGVKGPLDWSISNIRIILEIISKTCKFWVFVSVCVCFLALHWEAVCSYLPQAGCPEVSVYSLLCSELTRCFDTGAKLKMFLFREATNEVLQQTVLMTEVETERNISWMEPAISLQCGLNIAISIIVNLTWLLFLRSECAWTRHLSQPCAS